MNRKSSAYAAALFSALLMGSLGAMVRQTPAGAECITLARLGLGLVFFLMTQGVMRRWSPLKVRPNVALLASGVLIPLTMLVYIKSIQTNSLANAALMLYAGPPLAVLLARILLKEHIRPLSGLLVLTAFAGLALLIGMGNASVSGKGWVFGPLSALCYGLYITANRAVPDQIPDATRTFYQLAVGVLVLLPVVLMRPMPVLTVTDWAWLALIGFTVGFLAVWLMIYALKRLAAQQYGVVSYIEPVVGALWGVWLFSESMGAGQILGGGIIVMSGLGQVLWGRRETPPI